MVRTEIQMRIKDLGFVSQRLRLMFICVHICKLCVCLGAYKCIFMCVDVYIYVYMSILCLCIYLYIYLCVYLCFHV